MQRSCCVVTWGGVGSRTVYDFVLNHSDVSRALSHSFRWLAACQLEFCISLRCWTIKRLSLTSVKQKCRREGTISQPKVAFISSASYTTAERSEACVEFKNTESAAGSLSKTRPTFPCQVNDLRRSAAADFQCRRRSKLFQRMSF